ncbi:cytochrome c [Xenophilus arseniciresistens]|uniref:Cytochrome c n=1 Tax=Xenophilus arseniciresistens TaxID=1283306 RepID=A0AAE3NEH9_9BURK|nr:cytochrome c [Xenophilus arseniciresistens]MDA7418812.1 cytochrome c [Xenophilus arseniciresistens]
MSHSMFFRALAIGALAMLAAGAQAQQSFATPQEAIKFRQATLKEMQQNFKKVADMASGREDFDAKVAETASARAAELIKLPWAGFGPGTEGGKASPAIWKEQDKFMAAASRAEGEVAKVAAAAKTGNLDAIKAAVGGAGASCKACHDMYRN